MRPRRRTATKTPREANTPVAVGARLLDAEHDRSLASCRDEAIVRINTATDAVFSTSPSFAAREDIPRIFRADSWIVAAP
jgi:hypothetical protein